MAAIRVAGSLDLYNRTLRFQPIALAAAVIPDPISVQVGRSHWNQTKVLPLGAGLGSGVVSGIFVGGCVYCGTIACAALTSLLLVPEPDVLAAGAALPLLLDELLHAVKAPMLAMATAAVMTRRLNVDLE